MRAGSSRTRTLPSASTQIPRTADRGRNASSLAAGPDPAPGPDALAASDALLFPSAWVEDRVGEDHRRELLGGLARRFGITVINANWGVGVPRVWGQGGSRIATPEGAVSRLGGGARSAVLHTLHTATGD